LADFPELLIRDYQSLVAALRAVQRFIGISNACLEEISGLPSAAADKYLGPSQTKRIGPNTLGLLLGGLGIRLRVEIDLEQTQRLAHRWEKRRADHVREHTRLAPAARQAGRAAARRGAYLVVISHPAALGFLVGFFRRFLKMLVGKVIRLWTASASRGEVDQTSLCPRARLWCVRRCNCPSAPAHAVGLFPLAARSGVSSSVSCSGLMGRAP
jgi:hypothetical protein